MSEGTGSSGPASTTATSAPARPPPPLCPLIDDDEDYDAWVLAGGRLFRAHSSVLASHSAYLRGAAGGGGARVAGGGDVRLLLPHIPSAGFAAILTYMYTGRLPLTPSTLYEVLLAGHLLQMASVVSLCQALLTTAGAGDGAGLGVVGEVPPALSMWRGLARLVPPHHHNNHSQAVNPTTAATIIRPTPTRPRPLIHPALNTPQDLSQESELMEVEAAAREERTALLHHHLNHHHRAATTSASLGFEGGGGRGSVGVGGPSVGGTGAVVLDVATCDGPVFFERVVNRAYKANPLLSNDDSETETEINVDEIDSCDDMRPQDHEGEGDGTGVDLLRLRAVSESGAATNTTSPQPMPSSQSSRTYHCVYCNHTFKSHYCYQKHMRRHINPITVEVDKLKALQQERQEDSTAGGAKEQPGAEGSISSSSSSSSSAGGAKSGTVSPLRNRPSVSPGLRILDLNVQYFPCKTCGSKFPSYYFVHKHRRLCHQEEESGCGVSGIVKKVAPPPPSASQSSSDPTPSPVNLPTHSPVAPQPSAPPPQPLVLPTSIPLATSAHTSCSTTISSVPSPQLSSAPSTTPAPPSDPTHSPTLVPPLAVSTTNTNTLPLIAAVTTST